MTLEAVVFRSKVNDRVVVSIGEIESAVHAADRLEGSGVRSALPSEASLPLLNLKPCSSLKKTELPFPRSSEPLIPQRLPIQLPFDI